MSSKPRLREQELTHKPRIIRRDDEFHIEYVGVQFGGECLQRHESFEAAVMWANDVANRQQRMMLRTSAA